MLPSSSSKTQVLWEELDPRDLEIERLKRTNFNLRLRVFHLEGCLGLNKDSEKVLERGKKEQELMEELQREVEKKEELLLSARDLIRSLKSELTERNTKQDSKHEKDLFAVEQVKPAIFGVSDVTLNTSTESGLNLDTNDIISRCEKIMEKLRYFTLGEFAEESKRIYTHLKGQISVQVASNIVVQFLDFIDRLLASILQGEFLLRPNNKLESQHVQTEPTVALPNTFMSNLIKLLKYLVDVRLQLQGIVQGDETSQPVFPETDDAFVGDEVLKLMSNEVVDWDQIIDQIKLQKEDLTLTYDALEEAEGLRDEAVEALETTEVERDAAVKLIENLKELASSIASNDVTASQRILEEIGVGYDFIAISNDWKADVLNGVKQQNDAYQHLEEAVVSWRKRWDSLTYDDLHEFNEDGKFTCFVKEEKMKLEQKVYDLSQLFKEEQEMWNKKIEALKEERDLEIMRCQQLEDESMRMIEEQVELHKTEMEQLQKQLYERTKTQENLERELEATCDIIEDCKLKTTGFLDMMKRLEYALLSLDENILESIQIECTNEEILKNSFQVISQLKQRITSTDEATRNLLYMLKEQDRKFDAKVQQLDRGTSKLESKVLEWSDKVDYLRKELFQRNQKVEEQRKKIILLEEEERDREFQYYCREEEHRKQQAIIKEEKESTLIELSTCREEYRLLYDEWLQLCEQVEDVTSALEQHEVFSKQLEEEKENLEVSVFKVDEERKQIEHKYKHLYSLHFEVRESLLREVKLWKAQFSSYWEDNEIFKETIRAFQEEVQSRWSEIVSVFQEHYALLCNRLLGGNEEAFQGWKPLEFEFVLQGTNFFPEFVKHLGLLSANIQLLSQELESSVVVNNISSVPERHFICQHEVTFSLPEETVPVDNNITVTTTTDRETLRQMCNFIRSWNMEGWFQIMMRRLLELKRKLTRLEEKQERALSTVKLRDVRYYSSTMKEFSASKEPKIRRRFSFSPATGQKVSPLQYLRWKEREQEEGILRHMRDKWSETQRYRNM
ncbi:hypothetical protein Gasu2_45340 [Galdieria sulphuraria]|nr:hypothetical protein Gasu2_45340 [Galdieria sulphuraria]